MQEQTYGRVLARDLLSVIDSAGVYPRPIHMALSPLLSTGADWGVRHDIFSANN